ncbi:MAG TPA: adenylate/guanylate cyclase domain-containing protein [Actinomycetota bacterium]|nr:adenylate/guanylate cyclase domain-containing protein [Actinomycetota bacterium]
MSFGGQSTKGSAGAISVEMTDDPGPLQESSVVPSESTDELKPITALFADVVGSTALGERLAPNEVKALIGECVSRMAAAVEEFGGVVQAYMGDGICAYFGVPVANEDDPERAARAAIRIREDILEYGKDVEAAWGIANFNVRVGINSGQTAVGLVGASDPQAVALGDTTNTAARLQSATEPGSIAVGEATWRRIGERFVLEEGGSVTVKGKADPLPYWRLIEASAQTQDQQSGRLFGRDEEVNVLKRVAADLADGRGQVVTISGDPGLGKTRMMIELRRLLEGKVLWLETRCLSYGGELPYWPLVQTLRQWLDVRDGEADIAVRTKLRARVQQVMGGAAEDVLPYLSRLLSLPVDPKQQEGFDTLERSELTRRVIDAYVTWLEALCATQAVALAIDDLHWIDAPSQEALTRVLPLTDRAPLMVVSTLRLDLEGPGRAIRMTVLEDFPHRSTDMALSPLDADAARSFADSLAPDVGLDAEACASIVALAEGNPLYLEELMSALIQGGELVRRRTWTLSMRTEDLLPPALESLLISRIDRLPEAARRLAQIAAVVGRTFSVDVLKKVADDLDFEGHFEDLLRAQIVREVRRFPVLECTFKHGLVQEAAFSSLTPPRRRDLYGRVAAAHEEIFKAGNEERPDLLAFYYYRSDDLAKALFYSEAAAQRAEEMDPAKAAELWARAKKIAAKVADSGAGRRADERLSGLHRQVDEEGPAPAAATPLQSSTLATGTSLGGYLIEEFLGDGATGTVYRAVDAKGAVVAMKVLKAELADDQVFRRRFDHEVRAAGEVSNDHLVGIRGSGEAEGLLYIAMDYLEGRALNEIIESEGHLDPRETIRIIAHIGSALDSLHEAGIVHRDVKPSNVVVGEEGAVLTDLGLAKGRAYTVLTRPGQIMGTLDYMAPEIIRGEEAGPASDIYGLACIAYECIAGRPPFADKGVFQVGMAHVMDEPADPTLARPEVPAGVGWAITQALAKDPDKRPPSGIAFANLMKMGVKG